ncbi:MAG: peptidoglycan-binding domain-containing protein [Candidatus Omnitrophica bacterium]|nr:peptidoglycan-binding domain-containing protein [Candidatus Omnitrophota bacterium]
MKMKRSAFIILTLALVVYLAGCGKKQKTLEEMQEPMSMEAMSALSSESKNAPEAKAPEQAAAASMAVTPQAAGMTAKLEPLPPSGPYKPSVIEIQTALKNSGYYTGKIDGKIGPRTKAAIAEFQKANGLKADGKVGPKTWAALSRHLNPAPAPGPRPSR